MFKDKQIGCLKPCPWCGGKAYIDETFNHFHINCNCKKSCPVHPSTWLFHADKSLEQQIKEWNHRKEV